MKKILLYLFAAAISGCTPAIVPDDSDTPAPGSERLSINVRLSDAETRALINDSGSGAASFSWEDGDEIGVVAGGKLVRFKLSGKSGDGTGTFTASVPEGSSIEDGAPVAYPYVPEDYNESTHSFSLSFPSEYESSKDGDFRHRWAGTLVKENGGNYRAVLEHGAAILRVSYSGVPSEADAIRLSTDKEIAGSSKSITVKFSWHASTMHFYFPVPAGSYGSFSVQLLSGGSAVDGSLKTLSGSTMALETGKIYRTPEISLPGGGSKVLVAYFSFTNTNKGIAESLAGVLDADLYSITPSQAYGSENNNYYDSSTRAYKEQYGPASARPEIEKTLSGTGYGTVLLGFPIWYGKVPRVILSFLDAYDFSGKTVIPFCTSGSSGIGSAQNELQSTYPGINWVQGARLNGYSSEQLKNWTSGLVINENMNIKLTIGGKSFEAELAAGATAKAFSALLPMTLNMNELNGNEKYCYLDKSLPSDASNPGTIHTGDILLYGNNCVVVFYKTFKTSYSYTRIGRITDPAGLEEVLGSGDITVRFEK